MPLRRTLKFILDHPLNRDRKIAALQRFVRWQVGSRVLSAPMIMDFVNDSKLIVRRGMEGATGNLYCGLHEFEDMAFTLHLLRERDTFFDVGANIGSYTVLASAGIGARSVACEPIPSTFEHLLANLHVNRITDRVRAFNIGLGSERDRLHFTGHLNSMNHVLASGEGDEDSVVVEVLPLDEISEDDVPRLMKIDVEGVEARVLEGGQRTLDRPELVAVILELNGSGARYGVADSVVHHMMLDYGFECCSYAPFERRLTPEAEARDRGNTLYVRERDHVAARLADAAPFTVLGRKV